jgi:hypothetical protein
VSTLYLTHLRCGPSAASNPSHPTYLTAHTDDWRWSIVLNGSPGVLMLLLLPFVPESPSWLISKGGDEAATKVSSAAMHMELQVRMQMVL